MEKKFRNCTTLFGTLICLRYDLLKELSARKLAGCRAQPTQPGACVYTLHNLVYMEWLCSFSRETCLFFNALLHICKQLTVATRWFFINVIVRAFVRCALEGNRIFTSVVISVGGSRSGRWSKMQYLYMTTIRSDSMERRWQRTRQYWVERKS